MRIHLVHMRTFARTSEAAADMREIPGVIECVHQSLNQHCQACTATSERNYEKLL